MSQDRWVLGQSSAKVALVGQVKARLEEHRQRKVRFVGPTLSSLNQRLSTKLFESHSPVGRVSSNLESLLFPSSKRNPQYGTPGPSTPTLSLGLSDQPQ